MKASSIISLPLPGREVAASLFAGQVTRMRRNGRFMIDGVVEAVQAVSCTIVPREGDEALYARQAGKAFIIAVLAREGAEAASLRLPDDRGIHLQGRDIKLSARQTVDISALGGVSISSLLGALSLNSKNLFINITETLVESVRRHISRVGQYALEARELLRLHGKHQVITADRDVRIDGERINMG